MPDVNEQTLRAFIAERLSFIGVQFLSFYLSDPVVSVQEDDAATSMLWAQAHELFYQLHIIFGDEGPSLREWARGLIAEYDSNPQAWMRKRCLLSAQYLESGTGTERITESTAPVHEYRRAMMAAN